MRKKNEITERLCENVSQIQKLFRRRQVTFHVRAKVMKVILSKKENIIRICVLQ